MVAAQTTFGVLAACMVESMVATRLESTARDRYCNVRICAAFSTAESDGLDSSVDLVKEENNMPDHSISLR